MLCFDVKVALLKFGPMVIDPIEKAVGQTAEALFADVLKGTPKIEGKTKSFGVEMPAGKVVTLKVAPSVSLKIGNEGGALTMTLPSTLVASGLFDDYIRSRSDEGSLEKLVLDVPVGVELDLKIFGPIRIGLMRTA